MKLFFLLFLVCFININVSFGKCNQKLATVSAPFVVEAQIIVVDEPPMLWSESFIFTYQAVEYKVQNVIKGENISEKIVVKHAVIEGSLASDKNKPQLSPTYFSVGEKLILFLDLVNREENLAGAKKTEFVSINNECSIYLKTENSKIGF